MKIEITRHQGVPVRGERCYSNVNEQLEGESRASDSVSEESMATDSKSSENSCISARNVKRTYNNIDTEIAKLRVLPEEMIKNNHGVRRIESLTFVPTMRTTKLINMYHTHTNTKTYNLFGLKFIPVEGARVEMLQYLEPMVIGIITDDYVSCHELTSLLPPLLFNHYGTMGVEIVELSSMLKLDQADHKSLLDFMLIYLTRCFGFKGLNQSTLNCPLYVVPLKKYLLKSSYAVDPRLFIDWVTMRYSYKERNSERKIQCNHIVVISKKIIAEHPNQMDFFLVDRVLTDLNPGSQFISLRTIKNMNRGTTFANYFGQKYKLKTINPNQSILRVKQLQRGSANFTSFKKMNPNSQSKPIHFLEETLEYFHSDPNFHIQSFYLAPIMFRIFQLKATKLIVDDIMRSSINVKVDLCSDTVSHCARQLSSIHIEENGQQCNEHGHQLGLQSINEIGQDAKFLSSLDHRNNSNCQAVHCRKITCCLHFILGDKLDVTTNVDKTIQHTLPAFISSNLVDVVFALSDLKTRLTNEQREPLDTGLGAHNLKTKPTVDCSIVDRSKFDSFEPEMKQSRIEPLLKAFTLKRACDLFDLERYENVGDSFLKFAITIFLHNRLDHKEGVLHQMRSRLISNDILCRLALRKGLGNFAMTKTCDIQYIGYLFGNIPEKKIMFDNELKEKDLADIFEAIIGSQLIHFGHVGAIAALRWLGIQLVDDAEFVTMKHNQKIMIRQDSSGNLTSEEDANGQVKELFCTLRNFENIIDYKFKNKFYLLQAFSKTINESSTRSYQRLEFSGDAILDYLVTLHIYNHGDKSLKPGQITTIREALVNNSTFARLAMEHNFDLYVIHCQQSLREQLIKIRSIVDGLSDGDLDIGLENLVEVDAIVHVKLLADVFESVAAAIFMDSGSSLDTVWSIYYPIMKDTIEKELREPTINPVRRLYEIYSGRGLITYKEELNEKGKKNDNKKRALCIVKGVGQYMGIGQNLRQAKCKAALVALKERPSDEKITEINNLINNLNKNKTKCDNRDDVVAKMVAEIVGKFY